MRAHLRRRAASQVDALPWRVSSQGSIAAARGSTPGRRGEPGSFERGRRLVSMLRRVGEPLQRGADGAWGLMPDEVSRAGNDPNE